MPGAIRGVGCTGASTSVCRACGPRTVPLPRTAPFPTPRLLGSRLPVFHRYDEAAKTPTALLPALCSSHCAGIPWVGLSISLPEVGKPAASRPGCCYAGSSRPAFSPKDADGSPMFPGNPNVPLPCSQTPAGPRRLAFAALRCCSRFSDGESSSHLIISRLDHTA